MSDPGTVPGSFASAREEFLALVSDVRPELHRYCARLTGSAIEGEDIVQEALAKAFYAMSLANELPPLRPWLFRIAHNTALDYLKSHRHRYTEVRDDLDELASSIDPTDGTALRAALASFLALPIAQRSAVILKDVLDHSLEETSSLLDTTVPAVKAALVRGRAALREAKAREDAKPSAEARAQLDAYVALFNARDWDGVRRLVGDECSLDLVTKSQRRGKAVGAYFGRYEKENVRLAVATVDGHLALAAYPDGATTPAYFLRLEWEGGKVSFIRDYRYVPYIAREAHVEPLS